MPSYLQIGDDPTKWWLGQPVNASQLAAGQPLNLMVIAPLGGTLLLSPKFVSVALFDGAAIPAPLADTEAAIYLPTAAGPSSGHVGYALPAGTNEGNLVNQIMTAMRNGHSQTVPLSGGATLVLNGATLSFVVIKADAGNVPVAGGPEPHG